MFDPIIEALRALEADNGYISGVYTWFRWLRYHIAYGVTSANEEEAEGEFAVLDANGEKPEAEFAVLDAIGSEEEDHDQAVDGIGMLSHAAETMSTTTSVQENMNQTATANLPDGGEYQRITAVPLGQLQSFFRKKIFKQWKYVHSNAMAVAFLLDPATSLDDFAGDDDENVDEQVCMLATRCGLITPANMAKLTAEILKFKFMKRRGGEDLRMKYLEASPRDYWGAKDEKNYPLLKKVAQMVFAVPTSSAASERAWSIFNHIHSKRRNRLSVEKVERLAYTVSTSTMAQFKVMTSTLQGIVMDHAVKLITRR
ncbi:hAT family C-terminal dimerization region [Phytophthora infestans]|nr:hAT family C-terminal dimerization region [Phytophthora infestans]